MWEFLLTGDLLTAAAAERIGLINRVVPAEQLMATALTLAQRLATGPTQAMCGTKASVNKILRDTANLVLDTSLALERHCFATADHQEAIQAFVEKREPKFTGRSGDVWRIAPWHTTPPWTSLCAAPLLLRDIAPVYH